MNVGGQPSSVDEALYQVRNHVLHLLEPTIDAVQHTHANHQYDVMPTPMLGTTDQTSTPVTRLQQRRHHLPRLRQSPSDVILRKHQQRAVRHPRLQVPIHKGQSDEVVDPIYNSDECNRPLGARLRAKLREIGRLLTYPRVFACCDQDPLPSSSEKYANFTCAGGTAAELLWNVSFEQQAYRKKLSAWSRR